MEVVMQTKALIARIGSVLVPSITRASIVAAFALTSFAIVTETHARDIGEIGMKNESTDRIFRSVCRPGDVIIGFNMRSGTALDAIVPICIALNPQGTEWVYSGEGYVSLNCP
jgi:hypothetical protein